MNWILSLSFLISVPAFSQSKLNDFFKKHTTIKEPFELRDPFQKPQLKTRSQKKRQENFDGVWDYEEKITKEVKFDDIKVTGVLIGKNRRVMLKISEGKKIFKMKEGDVVGPNGPIVRAILPGGVIFVEQINNIYGEPEYIETVIPISK